MVKDSNNVPKEKTIEEQTLETLNEIKKILTAILCCIGFIVPPIILHSFFH
jgi:hypothetical protein